MNDWEWDRYRERLGNDWLRNQIANTEPPPSPEQIAADARTRAIDDLVKVTCINRGEAARIYDAGYRLRSYLKQPNNN